MAIKRGFTSLVLLSLTISLIQSTLVTFYVDHEVDQPLDYVEINAVIKVNGDSLEASIQGAADKIDRIQSLVVQYCQSYTAKDKQKEQCADLVQASAFSINPLYEILKKKQMFAGFVVAHQILIRVKQSDTFGKLVDDILKIGVNKINSLEWKPKQEVDTEEIALQQGLEQATNICKKLGATLAKIVSVQEVTDFGEDVQQQEEGQEGEGEEQEEEDQQEQVIQPPNIKEGFVYYKFIVECSHKKGK